MRILFILCLLYSCDNTPTLVSKCIDNKIYYCYTKSDYCQTYLNDNKKCQPKTGN